MKKLIAIAMLAACCGCVNIYTRFPTTDGRIESCYQSTRAAAAMSFVCAFPQIMSDSPGDHGPRVMNLVTIPFLGLPCAVDACAEAVVDTVCLPVDWPLAAARKGDE